MNLRNSARPSFADLRRAFTLSEMMNVMAIFLMLMAALLSCQLFGMRLKAISDTKLAATAAGRQALGRVRNEIRSAKILTVESLNGGVFTSVAANTPQVGAALEINPTTNRNSFIRYYLDVADDSLKRVTSVNPEPEVLASFITNRLIFQAEDYQGNIVTNGANNRVVRVLLEFYRLEYPLATVGSGGMYDYYRLQTKIAKRNIE